MKLAGAAARAQQVPGPHLPFPAPTAPTPGTDGAGAAARENRRRRRRRMRSPFGCESRGVVQIFPQNKNSSSKCI